MQNLVFEVVKRVDLMVEIGSKIWLEESSKQIEAEKS